MNIQDYINQVISIHPEFTKQEIQELCEEYLNKFNKKTKESSKEKSLKRYLGKEFWLDFSQNSEWLENHIEHKKDPFRSIPKRFFQIRKHTINDYILRITGLNKQLGKTVLFEDAEMHIKFWSKIALIGKNWAGKSTLLKLLIGEEEIEHWNISIAKDTKFWFLSQDLFRESMNRIVKEEMLTTLPTITKNMHRLQDIEKLIENWDEDSVQLLEEQAKLIEWMIHNNWYQSYALQIEILKSFGFTKTQLDYKISQLSWWEQTKIQIAKFLLQEVDLLILDEPTNHLDIEWIMFLEYFCKIRGKTLICISHDKKFLNAVFSDTIEISNKKLESYEWNYDVYLEEKQKRYNIKLKNYTTQQKYLKQQEKFIERFRYKASKASQVQSRIKMLDKMEKVDLPDNDSTARAITFKIWKRLPNTVIEFEHLSVWYWNTTLIWLPHKLVVNKDMRIGIIWKNWVWKTTLLKTILWEIPALYWDLRINKDLCIWSYSQVSEELDRDATILEELIWPGISNKEARTLLGSLMIDNDKMDQKIATLSGGERAKVALTKMLLSKPHVIIMDEPTNHLDIPSKEVIKAMLTEFDGVSIIVSHDRDLLEGISNLLRVIVDEKLTVYHDLEKGFDALEDSVLG